MKTLILFFTLSLVSTSALGQFYDHSDEYDRAQNECEETGGVFWTDMGPYGTYGCSYDTTEIECIDQGLYPDCSGSRFIDFSDYLKDSCESEGGTWIPSGDYNGWCYHEEDESEYSTETYYYDSSTDFESNEGEQNSYNSYGDSEDYR